MTDKDLEKLKAFALQTGFPFENDLERILEKIPHQGTWSLRRNYAFPALDGDETKFRSLDFIASIEYPVGAFTPEQAKKTEVARIHFLVEAKYCESDRWWLTPRPWPLIRDWFFPLLLPVADQHGRNLFRSDGIVQAAPDPALTIVQSGRKISTAKASEGVDRDSLTGYQIQLIQGTTYFLSQRAQCIGELTQNGNSRMSPIELFVPILVTNVPLSVLHERITVRSVAQSAKFEDLCSDHPFVLVGPPTIKALFDEVRSIMTKAYETSRHNLSWKKPEMPVFPTLFSSADHLPELLASLTKKFEEFVRLGSEN